MSLLLTKVMCSENWDAYSMDGVCYSFTATLVEIFEDLSSNQEDSDTKLLLHANHAVLLDPDGFIIVRSPSSDVNINVLFVCMFLEKAEQIYTFYGTGESRKIFKLGSVDMSNELKSALIGFHAFTGNDYVSSFFKK